VSKSVLRTSIVLLCAVLIAGISAARLTSLAVAAPATAPTTTPSTAPTSPHIDSLLSQLSSPDWRIRERCIRELSGLGEAIGPRIQQFLRSTTNIEARDRAMVILAELEMQRRLGPIRVSLDLHNTTPQEAFAQLSQQGHILIRARRESLWSSRDFSPVTLTLKDVPFWQAMKSICVETGLKPFYEGNDGDALVLMPDLPGDMKSRHVQSGAFTIMLSSLGHRRSFAANADDKTDDVEVLLSFFVDPRWRVTDYPGKTNFSAAIDEAHPLPAAEPMVMQGFAERSPMWLMRGMLHSVPIGAKQFGKLSGNFSITIVELSEPRQIKDILKATGRSIRNGAQALQLTSIEKEGTNYRLKCVLTRGGLTQQSWRGEMENHGIQLLDSQGRSLRRTELQAQENGDAVSYELAFMTTNRDQEPATLVWQVPLEPRELVIPFEFKDVAVTEAR
jgi:hypothetical protein